MLVKSIAIKLLIGQQGCARIIYHDMCCTMLTYRPSRLSFFPYWYILLCYQSLLMRIIDVINDFRSVSLLMLHILMTVHQVALWLQSCFSRFLFNENSIRVGTHYHRLIIIIWHQTWGCLWMLQIDIFNWFLWPKGLGKIMRCLYGACCVEHQERRSSLLCSLYIFLNWG